jgi:hypothetical protein
VVSLPEVAPLSRNLERSKHIDNLPEGFDLSTAALRAMREELIKLRDKSLHPDTWDPYSAILFTHIIVALAHIINLKEK